MWVQSADLAAQLETRGALRRVNAHGTIDAT
jgi:hypothetical protein